MHGGRAGIFIDTYRRTYSTYVGFSSPISLATVQKSPACGNEHGMSQRYLQLAALLLFFSQPPPLGRVIPDASLILKCNHLRPSRAQSLATAVLAPDRFRHERKKRKYQRDRDCVVEAMWAKGDDTEPKQPHGDRS